MKQSISANNPADFQIVSQAFDSWNVQFRVDVEELLDQRTLLQHLRKIKQSIAQAHSLSESSMLFDGIIRKTRTDNYVDVVVRIAKRMYEKGNPNVRFFEGTAPDGTAYSQMKAVLDIFYLDAFEKPVMLDRVQQTIAQAGIVEELLDRGMIARKLKDVLADHIAAKDIVIAKGRFPDAGTDAEVEFFFQAVAEPGQTDMYYSSRKVKRGDLLCRKKAALPGKSGGMNVVGKPLPTRPGLDIDLRPGQNAALSFDATEIVAEADGVVVVNRKMLQVKTVAGLKEIPDYIIIKVNPVLRIEGDRVVDIAVSQTVEIVGNLAMGSRILTDCEVFVSGNVEAGSVIEAGDDVTVEGSIHATTLTSEGSVIAGQDIVSSSVQAKDQIIIKGRLKDSSAVGGSVTADSVSGSRIVSRNNVTLGRIDADENSVLSTICVGMLEFFRQRIRDNDAFIEKARQNLAQIEMILSPDLMEQITGTNAQTMLMRFLAKHRIQSDTRARQQIEVYRKLIESVPPTRELIARKEAENVQLLQRLAEKGQADGSMVVVRERMTARAVVSINNVEAEVEPLEMPVRITAGTDGNLIAERIRNEQPKAKPE